MIKTIRDKMKDKKGFTLVELIVVLVILAILAAILVPALLGYIDKAREKQITTNAHAAYVATQAILDEEYGLNKAAAVSEDKIIELTDITVDAAQWSCKYSVVGGGGKNNYKLDAFEFTQTVNGTNKTIHWNKNTGDWEDGADTNADTEVTPSTTEKKN